VEQLNEGHLDEEDIANLLNKNRNAVNKLRQQREAERLKALGLLEERKKRGKDRVRLRCIWNELPSGFRQMM